MQTPDDFHEPRSSMSCGWSATRPSCLTGPCAHRDASVPSKGRVYSVVRQHLRPREKAARQHTRLKMLPIRCIAALQAACTASLPAPLPAKEAARQHKAWSAPVDSYAALLLMQQRSKQESNASALSITREVTRAAPLYHIWGRLCPTPRLPKFSPRRTPCSRCGRPRSWAPSGSCRRDQCT